MFAKLICRSSTANTSSPSELSVPNVVSSQKRFASSMPTALPAGTWACGPLPLRNILISIWSFSAVAHARFPEEMS